MSVYLIRKYRVEHNVLKTNMNMDEFAENMCNIVETYELRTEHKESVRVAKNETSRLGKQMEHLLVLRGGGRHSSLELVYHMLTHSPMSCLQLH